MALEIIPFLGQTINTWNTVGAANGWTALLTSDGDTSYIWDNAGAVIQLNEIDMVGNPVVINSLTIRAEAKSVSAQATNVRARLKYNDSSFQTGANFAPTTVYTIHDTVFLTNSVTGLAFTKDEINGVGSSGIDTTIFQILSHTPGSDPRITFGTLIVDFDPVIIEGIKIISPIMTPIITPIITPVTG